MDGKKKWGGNVRWTLSTGNKLMRKQESTNKEDKNAVAILPRQVQSEENLLLGILKKYAKTVNVSHSFPLFHGSRGLWGEK